MPTTKNEPNEPPTTGEPAEPNTLKDQWGNERPWEGERYPEDSPAREGKITKPSGQGGSTPKSRPDHQDMFPKNHEAPESREYGERLARKEQGEDVDLSEPLTSRSGDTKTTTKRDDTKP
jgi:hypothetical protein